MQLYVPKVTVPISFRGQRVMFRKDRSPLVEEGHPIRDEFAHFLKPVDVDFPAPVKPRAPKKETD